MAHYPQYSPYFSTTYDQPEPVGHLGRGTHYSIFQAVEHKDVMMSRVQLPHIHRFAVVWDEDHDTMIIPVIEKMYLSGLFSPIQFIGERKGVLYVVFAARYELNTDEQRLLDHKEEIAEISLSGISSDMWPVEFGHFDRNPLPEIYPRPVSDCGYNQCAPPAIICTETHKILDFMRHVDALWSLGTYEFEDKDLSPARQGIATPINGGFVDEPDTRDLNFNVCSPP